MRGWFQALAGRSRTCSLLLCWCALTATGALGQQPKAQPPSAPPAAQTPAAAASEIPARVTERVIDSSIPDDPALGQMLEAYSPKVRALEVVIGKASGDLKKGGIGAGSLGSFVADGMRAEASLRLGRNVQLAVMNGGGLRKDAIAAGDVRARDIFELLPFENALVVLDLSGEQLLRLLTVVVSNREAQSGARIRYRLDADKKAALASARLLDERDHEREIDPKATYTVVTIDYLINRGGDRFAVLQEAKSVRPLGVTLRDAVTDYVKREAAGGREIKPKLDERFVLLLVEKALSGPGPVNRVSAAISEKARLK